MHRSGGLCPPAERWGSFQVTPQKARFPSRICGQAFAWGLGLSTPIADVPPCLASFHHLTQSVTVFPNASLRVR